MLLATSSREALLLSSKASSAWKYGANTAEKAKYQRYTEGKGSQGKVSDR